MKKLIILIGIVASLGLWVESDLAATACLYRFEWPDLSNKGFAWKGDVRQLSGFLSLPVEYHQFLINRGTLDSVGAVKNNPFDLGNVSPDWVSPPISTFAGDVGKPPDYYSSRLSEFLNNEKNVNQQAPVENRTRLGSRELITVALYPFEYNDEDHSWKGYSSIDLTFHGSNDLMVEPVIDNRRLTQILAADLNSLKHRLSPQIAGSPTPEYLIVTGSSLVEFFQPLLHWKSMKGIAAGIATIEDIVLRYNGVDDAEKLRNYLIECYHAGTRYVLLGGDENVVPIRYAFHANTSVTPSIDLLQICDLYFEDVDGIWDSDGDGVYGEPSEDNPNLDTKLLVGRLPLHAPTEISNYVAKLIKYEQNPNGGDYTYLDKALFISADQMRDYDGVGQHRLVAQEFTPNVITDSVTLVEAPTGIAADPSYPSAPLAIEKLSDGWGIITLLIHGVSDGWVIRSNQYNQWPKSYIFTASGVDETHGFLPNVTSNNMPGLVYSIGCNNSAFDMDTPPFPSVNPCVAQSFLAKSGGGAVAFVGYSRWGWIATSWRLEQSFIEYLYNTNNNPAEALRYSKLQYSYYRDLCYGLDFYGDPEMKIWTNTPKIAALTLPEAVSSGVSFVAIKVTSDSLPLGEAMVTITRNDSILAQSLTSADGAVQMPVDFNFEDKFVVTAFKEGYATITKELVPHIVLGIDDEATLPHTFKLHQNYPNPFNPVTKITFVIDHPAWATLEIYNILGQKIHTVVDARLSAGTHVVLWDGSSEDGTPVSSGIYFARLVTDDRSDIIKMSLLK